jgi:hypothetical protein
MIVYIVTAITDRASNRLGPDLHIVGAFRDKKDAEAKLSEAKPQFDKTWNVEIHEERVLGWSRYRVNNESAHKIYDLLVARAGANEASREEFIHYVMSDAELPLEFRFHGDFGFGGKVYIAHDRWYLDYYHEDRTDELEKTRAQINKILRLIRLRSEVR